MILYEDPKISRYKSRLKKVRLLRKLTQEELSEIAGVNLKSLSAYEQNPEKLNQAAVKTVHQLADALNCEIDDILNQETLKD